MLPDGGQCMNSNTLITLVGYYRYMTAPRFQPMAWVPNTHGFRFRAIDSNGNLHNCRVVRDAATGLHRIEGAALATLTGWLRNG